MPKGLTIGEFATVTHLSVRTLRRYHEAGLLVPATVDPHTSYRYYSPGQIATAQVIHRLRELDVPLAEVKSMLATDDADHRAELITGHLRRLEAALDRTRAAVVSLRRLLLPEAAATAVELRSVRHPRGAGRIEVVELPAADLAVTVHAGPHDDIDVTYGRLGDWVHTHALGIDGPVHETYLVGPRDTPDAGQWRTEIGWPVFRVA